MPEAPVKPEDYGRVPVWMGPLHLYGPTWEHYHEPLPGGREGCRNRPVYWWTCVQHQVSFRIPTGVDDAMRHLDVVHPEFLIIPALTEDQ